MASRMPGKAKRTSIDASRNLVGPTPGISRDGAHRRADCRRDRDDGQSNEQRNTGPDEKARQHVPPEFVEAQWMRERGTDEPVR
jgi:hypothetical protein